jgi:nucleoside-diphosphate-sugar epimerase
MTNRVLVTGANGFLGRAFARATAPSIEIVSLSGHRNASTGEIAVDLRDKDSVRSVIREICPSHVLNFASLGVTRDASTLANLIAVNTIGALNVVEALIDEGLAAHIVLFGTAYEYADSRKRLDESARLEPQSPYAISKSSLYYALKHYYADAPLTFLRLFNIFGVGEPSERIIPFITRKALNGEEIPLTGGEQRRDFMFVSDLVGILHRLVKLPVASLPGLQTINVGTGKDTSLRAFIGLVAQVLERQGIKANLKFGALPYRQEDPMRCVANNKQLINLLGDICFTDLSFAVEHTVQALNEH